MKICFFLLFLAIITLTSEAKTLYISSSTGELVDAATLPTLNRKVGARGVAESDAALWVANPSNINGYPLCEPTVDAFYNMNLDQYQIPEWVFFEEENGHMSSTAIVVDIYDLQAFVNYAFTLGVWHDPSNCEAIWQLILTQIIAPLFRNIPIQSRPTLTARDHGIAVDLRCKEPGEYSDFVSCSPTQYYEMTNGIVAIHTPKLRTYKK
jgi:hypothetical protein